MISVQYTVDGNMNLVRSFSLLCKHRLLIYFILLSCFTDKKQLADIEISQSKPNTSWVRNLVSENADLKETLEQWSSESEKLIIQNEIMKRETKKQKNLIEQLELQENEWKVEKEDTLKEVEEMKKALMER